MKTHEYRKNLATILLQNLTVSGGFFVRQLTAKTRAPRSPHHRSEFQRRRKCLNSEAFASLDRNPPCRIAQGSPALIQPNDAIFGLIPARHKNWV
jgi:hypothetical protein